MILTGAGSYHPTSYEALQAGWQRSNMQSLMDYAAMNNARAQAAQRTAVGAMFGGSLEQQQRMLYGTRGGAMIRYGSQFLEGMYGSGSYVDMIAAHMNITQNAGFIGSSFGRNATSVYGSGPVTDIITRRMFDRANAYFTNASGTDNLMRTQGVNLTDLGVLQQLMAQRGNLYGRNIFSVDRANLFERATSAARDLSASGNVLGARDIMEAVQRGGSEESLRSSLEAIASNASSGDIKGAIDNALKSTSLTNINVAELDKMGRETTEMAKVLNKLRDIYGELAASDFFKASSAISASSDPSRILSDIERFKRVMRIQGLGDNIQGAAAQQAGIANMLTTVFGSEIAAGGMATDIHSEILTQQRLRKGTQRHLTDEAVAASVVSDIGSVSQEANFAEMRRLAYEASISNDPAKKAAVATMTRAMSRTLDVTEQAAILSEAQSIIGVDNTLASVKEQEAALADTPEGRLLNRSRLEQAKASRARLYSSSGIGRGIQDVDTYTGILRVLGTDRFNRLLTGETLNAEDIRLLEQNGVNTQRASAMLSDKAEVGRMTLATRDVLNLDKSATLAGAQAERDELLKMNMEARNSARFGTHLNDQQKNDSLVRIGLNALIDSNKPISGKDVSDYIFATTNGSMEYSVDAQGKLIMTEDQIQAMATRTGADESVLRGFLKSNSGFSDFTDYMGALGRRLGIDADGRGFTLSQAEEEAGAEQLRKDAEAAARNRLGLEGLTGDADSDREITRKILAEKFNTGISFKNRFSSESLAEGGAAQGVRNVIHGDAYKGDPERRKQDAYKLRALIAAAGLEGGGLDDIGDDILKHEDYAGLRESFGIGELSRTMRKQLANDKDAGKLIAGYALAQAGGYEPTQQEKDLVERLQKAASSNQTIGHMVVEYMEVKKRD